MVKNGLSAAVVLALFLSACIASEPSAAVNDPPKAKSAAGLSCRSHHSLAETEGFAP